MANIGVLFDHESANIHWQYGINVFQSYIGELLSQYRIPFDWINNPDSPMLTSYDLIIVALVKEDKKTADFLWDYMEKGGAVVALSNLNSLAKRLGYQRGPTMDRGYADVSAFIDAAFPLLCLKSVPWIKTGESHSAEEQYGHVNENFPNGERHCSVVDKFCIGKGVLYRWSVDLTSTIVGLQQGTRPVLEDGVPAPDNSASIDDFHLKSDDSSEVHWEHDRLKTDANAPYFAYPYADLWREAFQSYLISCCLEIGVGLPFVGYWPEGTDSVVSISFDSDYNEDKHADKTLDFLQGLNIPTTWCMMEPGYSDEIYKRVVKEGHELAFHYNAVAEDNGSWGEREFSRQLNWLKEVTGLKEVTSNKNHLTRFEGWGELYQWCEKYGISSDQTRGNSKKGNVGFLFGTCHPYFPIAWFDEQNRIYDVLEIGFMLGDYNKADFSVVPPLLDKVQEVHGVAHIVFHQVHIYNQSSVRELLSNVVQQARAREMSIWTGETINKWYRARRKVHIEGINDHGEPVINCGEEIEGVVVYVPIHNQKNPDVSDENVKLINHLWCRKYVFSSGVSHEGGLAHG